MANCPNCKTKLPIAKTGFMSKMKKSLTCPVCDSYLEADTKHMTAIGVFGAGVGVLCSRWLFTEIENGSGLWFLPLIVVIFVFFTLVVYQSETIKLNLAEKPEPEPKKEKPVDPHTGPIPGRSDSIAYLKYEYRMYSKEKLIEVANSKDYREDAIEAATELLKEKFES
jgi:hypothetical protein